MDSPPETIESTLRGFTALETALIKVAIPFAESSAESLTIQFAMATVIDRTFTGVGSFTHIKVPPDCPPVTALPAEPFSPAGARIGQDGHLLTSILWFENGRLACFELKLLDPPDQPIDLTSIQFEVEPVWPLQSEPPTLH